MLKVGTFCSGIGSPEQALKNLNINHSVEFACEIDKFARITYEANHAAKNFYQDLTKLDFNTLPDVDLFVAGFPCQSFSMAGKREGFQDTRGTIFFHILEYLKIKKPDIFILENVKGLLSHDLGNTFEVIIKSLSKSVNGTELLFKDNDSLGYDIWYQVLNAKDYGIPQNRERIFIIGFKNDFNFKFPEKQELKIKLADLLESNIDEKYFLSDGALNGLLKHKERGKANGNGFGCNILDVNKPQVLSNTCGTSPGSIERNLISENYIKLDRKLKKKSNQDIAFCLTVAGNSGGNHSDMDLFLIKETAKNPQATRINNLDCSVTLSSQGGGQGAKTGLYAIPVLTPDRPEKRQNGRRFKNDGEEMFTLTSQDKHGIFNGYRVRRLTPLECFRLMGFPDSFIKPCSDSQSYKQAGNSIVVNVLEEIIKEVLKFML